MLIVASFPTPRDPGDDRAFAAADGPYDGVFVPARPKKENAMKLDASAAAVAVALAFAMPAFAQRSAPPAPKRTGTRPSSI
jgi:hypothetical protein